MFRRMMIIGALVATLLVTAAVEAPASATSGLADKASASSLVLDSGEVPLYSTLANSEGLKAKEASAYAIQLHHHRAWSAGPTGNRQRAIYDLHHRYSGWHWAGWRQWHCLRDLWNRESGWNVYAYNPSGAYGIPQADPGYKMGDTSQHGGIHWQTNPWTQIRWGLYYIHKVYGSPCAAWQHELSWNSYSLHAHPMSIHAHLMSVRHHVPRRIRAYNWALRNAKGHWYCWGGAGPSCYDCSGLVMKAYDYVGIYLPHQTQWMVDSGHLVRIADRDARKGDVVMYFGSGGAFHTGLVAYKDRWMLDASEPGVRIHVERIWGSPEFFKVRRRT